MGKRLHVAEKWQVKFADGEFGFNYAPDKFVDVMSLLECTISSYEPDTECASELECDMAEFESAIEHLRNLDDYDYDEDEKKEIDDILDSVGLDRDKFLGYLESMLEKAKTLNLYVGKEKLMEQIMEAFDSHQHSRENFEKALENVIDKNSGYNNTMHFSFF